MSPIEQTDAVNKLLDSYLAVLTSKQQTALIMTYREDMTLQEIADSLGIKKQTVHFNLHSGLKHMYELEAKLHLVAIKEAVSNLIDYFNQQTFTAENQHLLQAKIAELNTLIDNLSDN